MKKKVFGGDGDGDEDGDDGDGGDWVMVFFMNGGVHKK